MKMPVIGGKQAPPQNNNAHSSITPIQSVSVVAAALCDNNAKLSAARVERHVRTR